MCDLDCTHRSSRVVKAQGPRAHTRWGSVSGRTMAQDARARRAESRERRVLESRRRSGTDAAPSKPASAGAKLSEPSVGGSVGRKRRTRGSVHLEEAEAPTVPTRRSRSAVPRTAEKPLATRTNAGPFEAETSARQTRGRGSSATPSSHGGFPRKRRRTVGGTPEKPVCPDSEQSEAESAATHASDSGSRAALDQSLLPSTSGEGEEAVRAPACDEGESRRECSAPRATASSNLSSLSWSALRTLCDRLSDARSEGGLSLALRPALERVQRQLEQQLGRQSWAAAMEGNRARRPAAQTRSMLSFRKHRLAGSQLLPPRRGSSPVWKDAGAEAGMAIWVAWWVAFSVGQHVFFSLVPRYRSWRGQSTSSAPEPTPPPPTPPSAWCASPRGHTEKMAKPFARSHASSASACGGRGRVLAATHAQLEARSPRRALHCSVFGGSFRRAASVSDNIEFLRDILTALAA